MPKYKITKADGTVVEVEGKDLTKALKNIGQPQPSKIKTTNKPKADTIVHIEVDSKKK